MRLPRPFSRLPAPLLLGCVLLIACLCPAAKAQDAGAGRAVEQPVTAPLPADISVRHSVVLPNRTLSFTVTAGSWPIRNKAGAVLAEVGFTSYVLDGPAPQRRPLVFAFNGGPGAASAWLHLGAMGPWRVELSGETIATERPPELSANAETWLDFADLVFLDPPGTGHARVWQREDTERSPGAANRQAGRRSAGGPQWFWSLRGDIETFAETIKALAERSGRLESPIVLVGESYGGFRAPLIGAELAREHAIQVSGLVLVSPVLDFNGRRGGYLPIHYAGLLPSLAATRLERSGTPPTRAMLETVEAYARGEMLVDLYRGPRDRAAVGRLAARVGELTGLGVEAVRETEGRVDARMFLHTGPLAREPISIYDAGMSGLPQPRDTQRRGFQDVFTGGLTRPLAQAMEELHRRIGWRTERPYTVLSGQVSSQWIWQNSPHPPQSLAQLDWLMKLDPRRWALVTHGFTDLVTPYMASAMHLDLLPSHGEQNRIQFEVYEGGHMFYSRDQSRARFRADGERRISIAPGPTRASDKGERETP